MSSSNTRKDSNKFKTDKELALKNMSKYLLSGAEMLRDSCPNCQVPLLKNKKDKKIFCGSCKRSFSETSEAKKIETSNTFDADNQKIINSVEAILLGKLEQISIQIAGKNTNDISDDLAILKTLLELLAQIKKI